MTSLVALATKDALVLGCDSLGTTSKSLVDPYDLVEFFDSKKNFELKKNKDGNPVLKDFWNIFHKAKLMPHTHMTHMTKLFSLNPLEMGVMSAGLVSIGDRTIQSLIEEFKSQGPAFKTKPKPPNYTVRSIAKKMLDFILRDFECAYPDERIRPNLELILGGYDKRGQIPKIVRIKVSENKVVDTVRKFGIVFGGQMKEIQRIVFGTDGENKRKIGSRHIDLLNKYRDKMKELLKQKDISIEIPDLSENDKKQLEIFSDGWDLDGLNTNWGDFSEQNAIECVDFFVDIMIKSQQFSEGMPSVGGQVHIALVTKTEGFRFVSREEYSHGGYFTPRHMRNR